MSDSNVISATDWLSAHQIDVMQSFCTHTRQQVAQRIADSADLASLEGINRDAALVLLTVSVAHQLRAQMEYFMRTLARDIDAIQVPSDPRKFSLLVGMCIGLIDQNQGQSLVSLYQEAVRRTSKKEGS